MTSRANNCGRSGCGHCRYIGAVMARPEQYCSLVEVLRKREGERAMSEDI